MEERPNVFRSMLLTLQPTSCLPLYQLLSKGLAAIHIQTAQIPLLISQAPLQKLPVPSAHTYIHKHIFMEASGNCTPGRGQDKDHLEFKAKDWGLGGQNGQRHRLQCPTLCVREKERGRDGRKEDLHFLNEKPRKNLNWIIVIIDRNGYFNSYKNSCECIIIGENGKRKKYLVIWDWKLH